MNEKGFAISGIMYPILILFLCFVLLILGDLASSNFNLHKITNDIMDKINGEYVEVE